MTSNRSSFPSQPGVPAAEVSPESTASAAGTRGARPDPEVPAKAADKPRVPWAELLRRTFLIDVLRCERCGARRKVLWPAVPPGPIARELLAHLGLDAAPPELAPARAPPWEESWAS